MSLQVAVNGGKAHLVASWRTPIGVQLVGWGASVSGESNILVVSIENSAGNNDYSGILIVNFS
jgi:hypothetical protein